ncbi:NAD(P)H-binding protein, partial [Streptomyces sp. NPDC059755]|uniref:NAD(P)H-binding protein n=1 Tax=Streptomyces sp. NPDC059755 TaxID=3346934 RepID=UPI003660F4BA
MIAGGSGRIARRLGRPLAERGDSVTGIVGIPAHSSDPQANGAEPVVRDLEKASREEVARVVSGADGVVGGGGGGVRRRGAPGPPPPAPRG